MGGQPQGCHRLVSRYAAHFKQNPPGLDHGNPVVVGGFPPAHAYFGGFFADWFVGEYSNPYLTAPLEMAGDGDPSGLLRDA